MSRLRRLPFIEYEDAFNGFVKERKELNDLAERDKSAFNARFNELKQRAKEEDAIAMDVLAYFYKTGIGVPENYTRYLTWEIIAAARGNTFAIEKLQFLIGYGCDLIRVCDDYDKIVYKNDIESYNVLYVLGKAICKILVRDFLKAYPVDVVELEDNSEPFSQREFNNMRQLIDEAIPATIAFLKS